MIKWRATKDCPECQGSGTLIGNEQVIKGNYWCSWIDCSCVLRNWNIDMKALQEAKKKERA